MKLPTRNIMLCAFGLVGIIGVIALTQVAPERAVAPEALQNGERLFQQNCAVCHGQKAQGIVDNWQIADQDGKRPPPPLNGTAHTWHHSIAGLTHTIRNGTVDIGGSMPAWKDTLSDDEILSIIAWISSLWPDEIRSVWQQRNGG